MKSTTIEGLAYLVKRLGNYMQPALLISCTELVLLVIKEKSKQCFAAIIKFLKAVVKRQATELLKAQLPSMLEATFTWDAEGIKQQKMKARQLMSLLLKKFVC